MINLNSLSIGPRGPIVHLNANFFQKLGHFSRERIPIRRNGEHGNGAFGHFTCWNSDIKLLTTADLFSKHGKRTSLAVRFTSPPSVGGSETEIGLYTVSVKFYTQSQGNWDLTFLGLPTFSTNEPARLNSLLHARSQGPNGAADYAQMVPETIVAPLGFFSDFGSLDGWKQITGFSSNTYKLRNEAGKFTYARFKLEPESKDKYLSSDEMTKLRGSIPDYISRDLYTAIERGHFPRWKLTAPLMSRNAAREANFNVFDAQLVRLEGKICQTIE